MSVNYVLVERGNPLNASASKKWYANAKNSGDVSIKTLGKEITQRSTVNHADTLAVLKVLTQVLGKQLAEGKIVRFGDFGSFQVSFSSGDSETAEKFHSSLIKNRKVLFRPRADVKETLNNLKFEKA